MSNHQKMFHPRTFVYLQAMQIKFQLTRGDISKSVQILMLRWFGQSYSKPNETTEGKSCSTNNDHTDQTLLLHLLFDDDFKILCLTVCRFNLKKSTYVFECSLVLLDAGVSNGQVV